MNVPATLLVASLLSAAPPTPVFEDDPNHTILGFKASTLLFDVPGRFEKYTVDIKGDPDTLQGASVKIDIDAASVNTANTRRDDHLRDADFLDVKKFPRITFTSREVKRDGARVVVTGTLDMHGVKQELVLPFTAVSGKNGAGYTQHVFKASVPIKRSSFKLGAESVAAKVGMTDDVELQLLLAGFFEVPKGGK